MICVVRDQSRETRSEAARVLHKRHSEARMKASDIKMEKRVGGLERHFRDGVSRLLIDNGDEWGGE